MQNWKQLSLILILPAMLLSYTDYLTTGPLQLEGVVTDAISGKPVNKAYLYVSKGNEEILTNEKGEFKLNTWQELPVSLTIEHHDYLIEQVKISGDTKSLKIRLKRK